MQSSAQTSPAARVSLIIPCFDRELLLTETLDSVQRQTFRAWEAIVVDDDSRDRSLDVAQQYAMHDARFRIVCRRGPRRGANVCRNQGFQLAKGEYIIFLDSDDLISESCLQHRVAAMDGSPLSCFGVFQTEMFDRKIGDRNVLCNAFTNTSDLRRFLSLDSVWHTSGPIWRRESLVRLGEFDESLLSFHDWDLHVRALIAQINYLRVPLRDHFYRSPCVNAEAIGRQSITNPDHLRSHQRLFEKTLNLLGQSEILDDDLRSRVAGLFWWLANRWQRISDISNAGRVWRRAHQLKLCTRRQYLEGLLMFRLYSIRGGRRVGRFIQRTWPPQYYQFYSAHFHNTPVPTANSDALLSAL